MDKTLKKFIEQELLRFPTNVAQRLRRINVDTFLYILE